MNIILKQLISVLLAANVFTTPVLANYNLESYIPPGTEYVQKEIVSNTQEIQESTYKRWIDQIDWSGKEYGMELYQKLENASIYNGALVDISKGLLDGNRYYIPVITLDGTSNSKAEAQKEINQRTSIIGQYMAVAYTAFQRDHPEIFWLSGKMQYSIPSSYYQEGNAYHYKVEVQFNLKSSNFDIRATEYQDTEKIISTMKLRDKLVNEIINSSTEKNRYEILKHFNEYLVTHNQYNTGSDLYSLKQDSYKCIGALKGSTGAEGPVCAGYAHAFKVLCNAAGIPCILVTGYVDSAMTQYHIWNYVQMEDKNWYAVDLTWNDTLSNKEISTDYFLVGAKTKIKGTIFENNHIVSAERLGIKYSGGPELSIEAYKSM